MFDKILILLTAVVLGGSLNGATQETMTCGVAIGYPPYQFSEDGSITGIDVDWVRAVAEEAKIKVVFEQRPWDDIMALLRYGRLDCVGGMEVEENRRGMFEFTSPYYFRRTVVFVLEKRTDLVSVDDLVGKVLTGDKDSFIEKYLSSRGLIGKIRLKRTKGKELSMELLKNGEADAIIAPWAVGKYLAEKLHVKVKMLEMPFQEIPVAVAVSKSRPELLEKLEAANQSMKKKGHLKVLQLKYHLVSH